MPIHSELDKLRSVFGKFEEQCPLLDLGLLCLKPASGNLQVMGLRVTATSRSPREVLVEGPSFLAVRREVPASRLDLLLEEISEGCVTLDGVDGRFPPHSNWHFGDKWWPRSRDAAPKWPTVRAYGSGSPYESAVSTTADYHGWLTSFERSHDVDSINDVVARLALDEMVFHSSTNHRVSHLEIELPLVAQEVGCRGRMLAGAFMLERGSLPATVKCFDDGNKKHQKVPMVMSGKPSSFSFPLEPKNGRLVATLKVIVKDMLIWEDSVNEVDVSESVSAESAGRDRSDETIAANEPAADVVLICALKDPEFAKVRRVRGIEWKTLPQDPADPHTYEQAEVSLAGGRMLRVVAATPNQVGPTSAAVLAAKMILRFRPKLVVLAGIAAGVARDGVHMGDVLVAEHTVDYTAGKVVDVNGVLRLQPDPKPLAAEQSLLSRLRHWSSVESAALNAIRDDWPARPPVSALRLHVGPLGSGSAVIASSGSVNDAREHWRKLVGIEMEAYGVHRACADTVRPAPMFLCAKSVCDFADASKNDDWQDYAAFTSAEFVFAFLRKEWGALFPALTTAPSKSGPSVW